MDILAIVIFVIIIVCALAVLAGKCIKFGHCDP